MRGELKNITKVVQKFEEETKDTLNIKLNITATGANYKENANMWLSTGEDIDMIFDAYWMNLTKLSSQGVYVDLSSYFNDPDYPGLQKAFSLKDNKGGAVILSLVDISEDSSKSNYGINMFREIKSTASGEVIGYFLINYKEDAFYNIYEKNVKENQNSLMIIDLNGTVVSGNNEDEINKIYKSDELIKNVVNSSESTTINNKDYFVSSSKVEGYNWIFVSIVANSYLN